MKIGNYVTALIFGLIPIFHSVSAIIQVSCGNITRILRVECGNYDQELKPMTNTHRAGPYKTYHLPVNEIVHIKDRFIYSIAPNALEDSDIENLDLSLCTDLLYLVPQSFNGLWKLRSLRFLEGVVPQTTGLFREVSDTLIHLTLSFESGNSSLREILLDLKNLQSLKIHHTNLDSITDKTFPRNLNTLTHLEISDSDILSIAPRSLAHLTKLETLKFESDKLAYLHSYAFFGLVHLKIISFRGSNLQVIHKDSFKNLQNLERLDLSNNHISEIDEKALSGLSVASMINFSNNKLTPTALKAFKNITTKFLYLSNNKINKITGDVFENSKIEHLFLDHNEKLAINKAAWEQLKGIHVYTSTDSEGAPQEAFPPNEELLKRKN